MADIIDGKSYATRIRAEVGERVTRLKAAHGLTPGLAVVLVGEDPASQVYVHYKGRQPSTRGCIRRSTGLRPRSRRTSC